MLDNCDNAGFMALSPRIHSFMIGIERAKYVDAVDRLKRAYWLSMDNQVIWIERFLFHRAGKDR